MTNDRSSGTEPRDDRARERYLRAQGGWGRVSPRILAEYRSDVGWVPSDRGRLDADTATQLWSDGVTLVRVRRRLFSSKDIALRRFFE